MLIYDYFHLIFMKMFFAYQGSEQRKLTVHLGVKKTSNNENAY